ncbi:unnamed protein product [Peronospora belbahrii]|uniref:Uncharacterized protein n=1 Tax=Peronospora belbahrii TaxID=622444 RepID=A0ABN8D3A2_9STRA|nr:unnamed protein product [Peronospora belbahrii]
MLLKRSSAVVPTVKAYDMSMLSTDTATDSSQSTVHARAAPPGASMTDEGKEARGLVDKTKSLVSLFRKSTSEKVEIATADVNRLQENYVASKKALEAGGGANHKKLATNAERIYTELTQKEAKLRKLVIKQAEEDVKKAFKENRKAMKALKTIWKAWDAAHKRRIKKYLKDARSKKKAELSSLRKKKKYLEGEINYLRTSLDKTLVTNAERRDTNIGHAIDGAYRYMKNGHPDDLPPETVLANLEVRKKELEATLVRHNKITRDDFKQKIDKHVEKLDMVNKKIERVGRYESNAIKKADKENKETMKKDLITKKSELIAAAAKLKAAKLNLKRLKQAGTAKDGKDEAALLKPAESVIMKVEGDGAALRKPAEAASAKDEAPLLKPAGAIIAKGATDEAALQKPTEGIAAAAA